MNPTEIKSIAETMRECGITHLKMHDLEMTCQPPTPTAHSAPEAGVQSTPVPPQSETKDEDIVSHKIEQLTSLMKVGDEELVDILFPDKRSPEDADANEP
jgi:hypothetical protein